MKSKLFLCLVFYVFFLICCCSEQTEKEVIKERTTLQDIVDNANAGVEIDLSQYDNITNYNAVVSKQLTIKKCLLFTITIDVCNNSHVLLRIIFICMIVVNIF